MSNVRILIVEDEIDLQEAIAERLMKPTNFYM